MRGRKQKPESGPKPESAAASKKMEDANSPEAPGWTERTRRHSCLALFGFPTSELAEDKCVWFGATRSVAVCHSGHRKGTQPLTLRPPRPPPRRPNSSGFCCSPYPSGPGERRGISALQSPHHTVACTQ